MILNPQNLQIVRYIVSGGTAAFINFALLYGLTEFLHVWYIASSIVGLVAGVFTSFFLQKLWAFENRSLTRIRIQFQQHALLSLANIGFNTLALYVLVEYLHAWYMFAQIVITVMLATMNYFIFKHYIFPRSMSAPIE